MIRQRLRTWWHARLRPVESWTLTQRNLYIVPTRAGLAFAFTLLLLLLASINYQLNLGYALTFLLAGSAVASMHMTHGALRGLTLHVRPPGPIHVGQASELTVVITNPGGRRHGLGFRVEDAGAHADMAWVDADAQSQTVVTVRQLCLQRGRWPLPLLRAETRFPFGLFRAWTVWRPAGEHWVWPAVEVGAPALPRATPEHGQGPSSRTANGGEFEGVRPWRLGDSSRQVAWKKVARSGELISRDHQESARQRLWLDWQSTQLPDPEARLSRLTAWAVAAQAQGTPYGLRMPGRDVACDHGTAHHAQVMAHLALWPASPAQSSTS